MRKIFWRNPLIWSNSIRNVSISVQLIFKQERRFYKTVFRFQNVSSFCIKSVGLVLFLWNIPHWALNSLTIYCRIRWSSIQNFQFLCIESMVGKRWFGGIIRFICVDVYRNYTPRDRLSFSFFFSSASTHSMVFSPKRMSILIGDWTTSAGSFQLTSTGGEGGVRGSTPGNEQRRSGVWTQETLLYPKRI